MPLGGPGEGAEAVCAALLRHAEDVRQEEHLDPEFLWAPKMLSEIMRCDGTYLVKY